MKKLLLFLLFSLAAFAQNGRLDGIAIGPRGPVPFALVAVCTQPANVNTQPCSPLANLCSSMTDVVCTSPNPLVADNLGNYHFYYKQAQGPVTEQIYGSNIAQPYVMTDQSIPGQLSGTNVWTGLQTFAAGAVVDVSGTACNKTLELTNTDASPTNPNKFWRINQATGALELMDSACANVLLSIDNGGNLLFGAVGSPITMGTPGIVGSGNTGNLTLFTGAVTVSGTSGNITLSTGLGTPSGSIVFNTGNSLGSLQTNSLFSQYKGAVAGQGLVPVRAVTSQKAETGTADASVLALTPPAVAGTYRACFTASVSSATTGVIGWTLSFTDSNGNAQANIAQSLFQQGTGAPATTFTTSAAGNYQSCSQFDINNAAAAITVKWVGGGTTAAKVSASIEQII